MDIDKEKELKRQGVKAFCKVLLGQGSRPAAVRHYKREMGVRLGDAVYAVDDWFPRVTAITGEIK